MDSRKTVFLLFLFLLPFSLAAYDSILMNRYLNTLEDQLRWESRGGEEQELKVTRYAAGRAQWSYSTPDITVYLDNHEFPQNAYALYGEVVTFPVTTEDAGSGALRRRQIALDAETGGMLWEKEIVCGITQGFFYSWSDGERLFLHNLHEYEGSQLICLDLKSGETLWETAEGLPQPALPVEAGDALILHGGLVREFRMMGKKDGSVRRYPTSSPVQIWRDRPLFLRKAGESCRVIRLAADGTEEILFEIPDNDGSRISSYLKDPYSPFFRALHKPVLNWAVYQDSLILQRRTGEGVSHLTAYSLTDRGEILWEIPLPGNREFDMDADFTSYTAYMNMGNSSVLLAMPDTAVFYQPPGRYLPLFVRDRLLSHSGLAVIDIEEGEPLFLPQHLDDENTYIFQDVRRSGEDYYYFLQRYSESSEGPSLVLKLDGTSGKFTAVHSYSSNIPDAEKWRKNPYLFLYQNAMDVLKWESISADLKEQLMENPGIPGKAFE